MVLLLAIGTVFYHYHERWGWIDSLYFSVTTLTTVGYGDISPSDIVSKVFTMIYILTGVGLLLVFLTTIGEHLKAESARLRLAGRSPEGFTEEKK